MCPVSAPAVRGWCSPWFAILNPSGDVAQQRRSKHGVCQPYDIFQKSMSLGNLFREGRRANRYASSRAQSWHYMYMFYIGIEICVPFFSVFIYIYMLFLFETWRSQAWQSLNRTWRSQAWQSKLRGGRQRWQSKTAAKSFERPGVAIVNAGCASKR